MEITYESICEKLGFDAFSYKSIPAETEYDGAKNPFDVLTIEELDFLMEHFKKNKKTKP